MNTTRKWSAAAAMVLLAGGSLAARAQDCDPAALTCYASANAGAAGGASFLDLLGRGGTASRDFAVRGDALAQPAVYVPATAPAPSARDMAPAGVGALDSAMGTELSGDREPAWLAIPKSLTAPDSSVAWIFGLGFLGFVILRRLRSAASY